jgi:hypothetical protein
MSGVYMTNIVLIFQSIVYICQGGCAPKSTQSEINSHSIEKLISCGQRVKAKLF